MTLLCGFQGCGKSTVGELLSKRLNLPFIDTDWEMERISSKPVRELYKEIGGRAFRTLESQVVRQLPQGGKRVIALGGGTLLDKKNQERLSRYSPIIYLELPLSLLQDRWGKEPAFAPTRARQESAFIDRVDVYQTISHLTLHVAGMSPEEVVEEIVRVYGE